MTLLQIVVIVVSAIVAAGLLGFGAWIFVKGLEKEIGLEKPRHFDHMKDKKK